MFAPYAFAVYEDAWYSDEYWECPQLLSAASSYPEWWMCHCDLLLHCSVPVVAVWRRWSSVYAHNVWNWWETWHFLVRHDLARQCSGTESLSVISLPVSKAVSEKIWAIPIYWYNYYHSYTFDFELSNFILCERSGWWECDTQHISRSHAFMKWLWPVLKALFL